MSAALVSLCVSAALAVGAPIPAIVAAPAKPAPAAVAPAPAPAPAPTQAPPAQPDPTVAPAGPSDASQPTPTPAPPSDDWSDPAPAQPADPSTAAPAPTIMLEPAPAPTSGPTVAVQPAPAPGSPPPPMANPRVGDALVITGALATAIGGVSLLFVSLPARGVRNSALRRAEREDALAFTSRKTRYERARRADDVMEGAFWVGAPLLVTGVALLVTGLVVRNNARARSRVATVPGGLLVRF